MPGRYVHIMSLPLLHVLVSPLQEKSLHPCARGECFTNCCPIVNNLGDLVVSINPMFICFPSSSIASPHFLSISLPCFPRQHLLPSFLVSHEVTATGNAFLLCRDAQMVAAENTVCPCIISLVLLFPFFICPFVILKSDLFILQAFFHA